MPNEGFLKRWSRLKAAPEAPQTREALPTPAELPTHAPHASQSAHALPVAGAPHTSATETSPATPLPTLADAAMLNADSDYAAFVARGVDADVRRLAMKKLFADPHFNLVDGLDIYMGDYNLPSPVSPAMLASLTHARSVFTRIDELLDPAAADEAAPSIDTQTPVTDAADASGIVDKPAPPDEEAA
ncbi:MAG: hypothetical protein JWR40_4348 [Massilia sp.]|nr:hypothetical protein [Massilia sp.]